MSETAPVTRATRRLWPVAGIVALVTVAVAVAAYLVLAPGAESVQPPTVPDSVFSPAGTALPDGLRVPEGAHLVGTPMAHDDPLGMEGGIPVPGLTWRAVLLVDGDVLDTWTAMRGVLAEALGLPLDATRGAGCSTDAYYGYVDPTGFGCGDGGGVVTAEGYLTVAAELQTVPGDVTGQYSIHLTSQHRFAPVYIAEPQRTPDAPPTVQEAPPPPEARPRPGVGEPLVTYLLAEEGVPGEFVLLEGSQLLVQYAVGSNAGFGVLLRVLPGASVEAVAEQYAATPRLGGGPFAQRTTKNEGQTVTSYLPPGEAGGYSGVIYAVDNATGDDFIYFDVAYD